MNNRQKSCVKGKTNCLRRIWVIFGVSQDDNYGQLLLMFLLLSSRLQVVDISRTDYEPSDLDILYAEGVTSSNGLACVDFSFPHSASDDTVDTADQHDSLLRWVPV